MESECPLLLSSADLKSILGATYGGATYGWCTNEGLLNNIQGMINGGLFDNIPTSDFEGQFDVAAFAPGSYGIPAVSPFGAPASSGSFNPTANWSLQGSSGSTQNGFRWGSASVNGSTYTAAPLQGTFNGYTANLRGGWNG